MTHLSKLIRDFISAVTDPLEAYKKEQQRLELVHRHYRRFYPNNL